MVMPTMDRWSDNYPHVIEAGNNLRQMERDWEERDPDAYDRARIEHAKALALCSIADVLEAWWTRERRGRR